MASYQDYYNGRAPIPGLPAPAKQKPPAYTPPSNMPGMQAPGEQYGVPRAPAVNPYAPKPRQVIRSSHSPLGSPMFYTPGQGVTQANPFAAMLGMFGGAGGGMQQPGYGFQMPQMQPNQYPQAGGSGWDIGPRNPMNDPRYQVAPRSMPAAPDAYGPPQYTGNPYLPRTF